MNIKCDICKKEVNKTTFRQDFGEGGYFNVCDTCLPEYDRKYREAVEGLQRGVEDTHKGRIGGWEMIENPSREELIGGRVVT